MLDAGCGSGRVTEQLLDRFPGISVVALDAAPSMLVEARARLARFGDRVEYVEADLARPLPVAPPVDVVVSTAAFHWVLDHDLLFAHLAAVLRPGGRLVAQCGGEGNIATVAAALRALGLDPLPCLFATPAETVDRLRRPASPPPTPGCTRSSPSSTAPRRCRRSWPPSSSAPTSTPCPPPNANRCSTP